MRISKKALSIPASMTLEVTAKVNQLKKEGKSIIGFTAGEPNFNTPDYIIESAKEALDKGITKYKMISFIFISLTCFILNLRIYGFYI